MKKYLWHACIWVVTVVFTHSSVSIVIAQPAADKPKKTPPSKSAAPLPPATPPALPGGALGGASPPQPPAGQPGDDFKPLAPNARVTFNLEDADLPDLVRMMSSITGRRFILPNKSRSIKATVYAPTKVTAAEAYRAFLSILELNGMTVVPSGRYLKIVETTGIENQALPTYTDGEVPAEDRYMTRIQRLNNVSAEEIVPLITKFKTKEGNVTAYGPTNTVIITDTGANMRRMSRIVQALDVSRSGEQVWIEPIKYAHAGDLSKLIQEMYPSVKGSGDKGSPAGGGANPPGGGGFASGAAPGSAGEVFGKGAGGATRIFPDDRTNSLIIVATEPAYIRLLELIRELDKPQDGGGKVHVHPLQNAEAEDTASTLSNLVGGSGGPPSGGAQGGQGAGTVPVFEGQVKVTAHKPANALVITASAHDYATLRRVIERLDAPRRQVFIEAVIMELSVDRGSKIGAAAHGGVPDVAADGSLAILGALQTKDLQSINLLANQDALQGLALGLRGPNIPQSQQLIGVSIPAFGLALSAVATSGETNVLSTPHLIAMDNQEAEITVGENVPLQTSGGAASPLLGAAGLGAAAGAAATTNPAQMGGLLGLGGGLGFAAPRQDVGTSIKITPHLNESDQIRLDIAEEISEAKATTEGTLGVRSITKRNAKTKLVVTDQQTVVIGGLMRDRQVTTQTKLPILGDIPILGMLFRQDKKEVQKTNLLLFLTPYIVRSQEDLRKVYERKMQERQEFLDRYFVFNGKDYQPPMDYSRTRGMVSEISNEMTRLKKEYDELGQSVHAPATHSPKAPISGQSNDKTEAEPTEDAAASDTITAAPETKGSAAKSNAQTAAPAPATRPTTRGTTVPRKP